MATAPQPSLPYSGPRPINRKSHSDWTTKRDPLTDNSVQRPDIQGFVGALHGVGANRGIFITTSRFSSGAREYANSIATRVVLIDGERLAELMIKYGVGVQKRQVFTVVEIDEDYFE